MIFVKILVEGQTEIAFVENMLAHHLYPQKIYVQAIPTTTRQAIGKLASKKGGLPKYSRVKRTLLGLLGDTSTHLVTTMFDFYGLPSDFPGMKDDNAKDGTCYDQATHLEQKVGADIDHQRFLPYLAIHEMEALLFTRPEAILEVVGTDDTQIRRQLNEIHNQFPSPEEINHDQPPSKRIQRLVPDYHKVRHIAVAASAIGIHEIRTQCLHFDDWLSKIEALVT